MPLVACENCGTKQDFSILDTDASCEECGASGESLVPVSDGDAAQAGGPDDTTVLVAEDDADFRDTLAIWLSDDDWTVREAADGEEALDALDGDVDVLVLDRRMPELSGPEVVDRLDETDFDGHVVVVSAYEADSHLSEVDVDGYLTKPVREETFLELLERIASK